ncbi:hypothetical protein GCM10027051_12310 [Niabella terrae]
MGGIAGHQYGTDSNKNIAENNEIKKTPFIQFTRSFNFSKVLNPSNITVLNLTVPLRRAD